MKSTFGQFVQFVSEHEDISDHDDIIFLSKVNTLFFQSNSKVQIMAFIKLFKRAGKAPNTTGNKAQHFVAVNYFKMQPHLSASYLVENQSRLYCSCFDHGWNNNDSEPMYHKLESCQCCSQE